MTEDLIMQYVPRRVTQLGFKKYHMRYRDFVIAKQSSMHITAWNDLYFIVHDPVNVVVESDYGIYDSTGNTLPENAHEHRGEIVILNRSNESIRIKFIQVIIVN